MAHEDVGAGPQKALTRVANALRTNALKLDLSSLSLSTDDGAVWNELGRLQTLHTLYLSDNQLTTIPSAVAQLRTLRVLLLNSNHISGTPQWWSPMASLAHLTVLALNNNELEDLPDVFTNTPFLQQLYVDHNKLTSLPPSVCQLDTLKRLDLQLNAVATLPPALGHLKNLRHLDVHSNQLRLLPDEVGGLVALAQLDLSHNQLATIPDSIGRMEALQELNLDSNRLHTLPATLGRLSSLTRLSAANNRLVDLPAGIGTLSSLTHLRLAGNELRSIPASFGGLRDLRDLDLSTNALTSIPSTFGDLSSLETLNLQHNLLRSLPSELTQLRRLTGLFVGANWDLTIPMEVLGPTREEVGHFGVPRPPRDILAYYLANRAGSRPLSEAKLILVGQGGVGKTSLVNKLTTGSFDHGELSTDGIAITDWSCVLSTGQAVAIHIWDFGGQEMMHATHRFFLTTRSVYLLVLDRRMGEPDLQADYWFRMIRTYGGPDAPVIVVLHKQRGGPFDVNRERWCQLHGTGLRFVCTDCDDDESIGRLTQEIRLQVDGLRSVKEPFPLRWFAIKTHLAGMKTDFIEYRDYQQLCKTQGVVSDSDQRLLAGFLHDLGIVLQYVNDPRLRFAYVLRPQWVTEGIYALLHAPAASDGVLTLAQARSALDGKKYSDEAVHFLLALLETFELSFAMNDSLGRVLIPQLLADRQPASATEFSPEECLNFGYQYVAIPEGLMPRLIVRTHHLSKSGERWKSGVILRHRNGCRALVRTEVAARQVRVHVEGPSDDRRELLGVIRHNCDVIHEEFRVEGRELVFAKDAPNREFSVADLETLREAGEAAATLVDAGKVVRQEIGSILEDVTTSKLVPLRIFVSYAHADERQMEVLRKGLKVMERNGLIRVWADREIVPGQKWRDEIARELEAADAIICQLSPDFIASDFCVLSELNTALKRQAAGRALLLAYILRACNWRMVKQLEEFQLLPRDLKPLRGWRDPDKYWESVVGGIETALERLRRDPRFVLRREYH
jgi:internalin A